MIPQPPLWLWILIGVMAAIVVSQLLTHGIPL